MNSNLNKVKNNMKLTCFLSLVILSSLIALSSQSATCLFCKRADARAAILESYSYCDASDTCLKDQWLYFN